MWTMPSGLPSSTTKRTVDGREAWFIIASASPTRQSGGTVFGILVMIAPTVCSIRSGAMWRWRSPSVTTPTSRNCLVDHANNSAISAAHTRSA